VTFISLILALSSGLLFGAIVGFWFGLHCSQEALKRLFDSGHFIKRTDTLCNALTGALAWHTEPSEITTVAAMQRREKALVRQLQDALAELKIETH
jgi:hypothetical protein